MGAQGAQGILFVERRLRTPDVLGFCGMTPTLETDRLLLRRWRGSDREAFQKINADPRVMEFFPALLTAEETDQAIARIEKHFEEHGLGSTLRSCGRRGRWWAMRGSAFRDFTRRSCRPWRSAGDSPSKFGDAGWPRRGPVRLSIMHSEICGCQVWSLLPYRGMYARGG